MTWPLLVAAIREPMAELPCGSVFATGLRFRDRVFIDGNDLAGVVTGFCWKEPGDFTVEVSWFANGALHAGWFSEGRLTRKEAA